MKNLITRREFVKRIFSSLVLLATGNLFSKKSRESPGAVKPKEAKYYRKLAG